MDTRIYQLALVVLLFVMGAFAPIADAQVLNRTQIDELSRSIVKIYAKHPAIDEDKGKREIAATGFIFNNSRSVVTALHVVSGAERIQVKFSGDGALVTVDLVQSMKVQDLALLRLPSDHDRDPLTVSTDQVKRGDEILALGYPYNIPTVDDTLLRVKANDRRLRDIIPANVKRELDAMGLPDTNAGIVDIDGHLLPGHSGAPVFNDDGVVVAISNGGLAVGAASRSWAIDARHLSRLIASDEAMPQQSVASSNLFAEELPSTARRRVLESPESDARLLLVREATFREMYMTTDDPVGLGQLVNAFYPVNPDSATYRIYRDMKSGATFVVPTDLEEPRWEDGLWRASSDYGLVDLYFRLDRTTDMMDIQRKSTTFERDVVAYDEPQSWMMDTNWTYPFAQPTMKGMTVRRLAYLKFEGRWQPRQTKQLIFTFSALNASLLSAAAKLNDNDEVVMSLDSRKEWFEAASAAFLTTIGN